MPPVWLDLAKLVRCLRPPIDQSLTRAQYRNPHWPGPVRIEIDGADGNFRCEYCFSDRRPGFVLRPPDETPTLKGLDGKSGRESASNM